MWKQRCYVLRSYMRNIDLELGQDKQPPVTGEHHIWSQAAREKLAEQSSMLIPNVHPVVASRIYVALRIHLHSVWYPCV